MSVTTNLDIDHIQESQNQKEVTANAAFDRLDGALAGLTAVDLASESGDYTLTEATALDNMYLRVSGALSAAVNLIVPDNNKWYYVEHGGTGFNVTVKTAAGTGIEITPGNGQFVYSDGTNVVGLSASGASGAAEATAKTKATATGAGGTTVVAIGANVDPNSVEVVVDRLWLERGYDYTVTESVPASGDYDQLTPAFSDVFPTDSRVVIYYYT